MNEVMAAACLTEQEAPSLITGSTKEERGKKDDEEGGMKEYDIR